MKIIRLSILTLVALSSSCVSSNTELSNSEKSKLIEYARKFVLATKSLKLNIDEKKIITRDEPEVRTSIKRQGSDRIIISWPTYTRTISAYGNGDLSKLDQCNWVIEVFQIDSSEVDPHKKKQRR